MSVLDGVGLACLVLGAVSVTTLVVLRYVEKRIEAAAGMR